MKRLNSALVKEVEALKAEGRAKSPERIITGYMPASGSKGPRYRLQGSDLEFIRMNSNSYMSLQDHPEMIKAADSATHVFGVGPGAVRFIDGTFHYHVELEAATAKFVGMEAAKIFTSSYMSNLGLAITITNKQTYWIGDALNHNSIIRAMRIANVPSANKGIFKHNDMQDLKRCLDEVPDGIERVVVIFDGIFSMRGDFAPMQEINEVVAPYRDKWQDGLVTVMDDCHGLAAYGDNGRGTCEHTNAMPDIMTGTYGKGFGVNGGFIAGSQELIDTVRQKADTYIYTNPLSVADCAASIKSIEIVDSAEGRERLVNLKTRTKQFRDGLDNLGLESIPGPHPVVPVLVRDTAKTHKAVKHLFDNGILVVGLTFPVVPRGDETLRFQINASHTEADIDHALNTLESFKG